MGLLLLSIVCKSPAGEPICTIFRTLIYDRYGLIVLRKSATLAMPIPW